jgi:hypothetical protein
MTDNGSKTGTYGLLYADMESALLQCELERRQNEGYSALIKLIRQYIGQVKAATGQPFLDEHEEITFFRDIWPKFYAKLFYYQLVNAYQTDREGKSPTAQAQLTAEVEEVISDYFSENKEFWSYYRDSPDVINTQFTLKYSRSCLLDPLSDLLDREWGTIAGYRAAWALAYGEFAAYLQQIKAMIGYDNTPNWEWHESKTALAELIVGLVGTASIYVNGKPATAAQLRTYFQKHYSVDLSDFNKLLYATDTRKKDDTPYLNKLRQEFLKRKERLGK